ncbi:threonine-phosphate decarboxylase CobD [Paenibacillus sp. MMS20-IR301]|uniref:threonine-phosphate decarboxylase CobD n=1 Tax=Paenibacillus sp. MMS20-IR301 TaxID=2895946 RepID=UPI0028E54015|nr:threonine-phosphate decarboxylase CobD [Paenibacillus sp. MMS20-IR301]WNS40993.1 threonine-phosphate decarboxylase CobD [Paenibacillus sp. MMS20-IR301]
MLEKYGHGGDLLTAAELYGGNSGGFVDFSANINPLGPPPGVLALLRDAVTAITAYPDPGHRRLKALLAEELGVGPDWITVANGAAESMALLLLAVAPRRVGIVEPCFSEYRQLAEQFGAEVLSVQGTSGKDYRASVEAISGLLEQTDLLFLGQPNNPNGVQYPLDELRFLARKAEACGTVLAVDEAFIDFIPEADRISLLPELGAYRHAVLVRSMTKFFAIPGLRLGFTAASPELAAAMSGKQVTWSVNGLALLAGEACLQSGDGYGQETRALIAAERQRLRRGLLELGCGVPPGEANFLLLRLPAPWTAAAVQERLGRRGILVRSCAMYPGLTPGHIRVAVKGGADNSRLLVELGAILQARV